MPKSIFIHNAREVQLGQLASHYGIPKSEMLERLIGDEIAAFGDWPDETPGLELPVANGKVCPKVGKLDGPILTPTDARKIASDFEALLAGDDRMAKVYEIGPVRAAEWLFARKGRGLLTRLRYKDNGEEAVETFTTSLARDYIRQLRRAADRAEEQIA